MNTVIDRDLDVLPWLSPVCTFCRHERGFRRCAAFEGQVPLEIWVGLHDHQRPYPGDHGIQFEPVPGAKVTTLQGPDWPVIRILRAEVRLPLETEARERSGPLEDPADAGSREQPVRP